MDTVMPLVSVIIPVYNVKPYLREALDSVINQTFQNLEIIIVDDGSSDGSEIICDQYQEVDSRIRVIHQENKGLSSARNAGLNSMHGDIVSFLDSDDAFLPNMIENLVRCMVKTESDIATCSFCFCQTTQRMSLLHSYKIYKLENSCVSSFDALQLMIKNQLNISVWNKLFRKHLFEGLRFPEGRVFEEQSITPLLIERAKRVTMMEQPMLLYRQNRPGSITASFSEQNALDWLYAMKNMENFIIKRTPTVFDIHYVNDYEDLLLRRIVLHFVRQLSLSGVSLKTKRLFEKEIEERAKWVRNYSIKTKTIYALYQINPRLCYFTKCAYSAALKVFRSLRHPHG